LKHGDTIRIEGLPTGYSYTLKETEAKDYIVTVDNKVSQEAQSVGKDITEDKKVTFENRKDLVPPTGLTTDGAIYLWLLLLVPLGLWVWLIGRKGLKND
ncbi:pilus ancillary protein 1, partial [Enterococcus faecalis]